MLAAASFGIEVNLIRNSCVSHREARDNMHNFALQVSVRRVILSRTCRKHFNASRQTQVNEMERSGVGKIFAAPGRKVDWTIEAATVGIDAALQRLEL
jgi:hypothetical protein